MTGHGDKVNKVKPTLVKDLDGVFLTQITCGWSHSVALTSSHEVYTWGNGDHGKLGHGCGKKVSTPQLVEKLVGQKVVCVASYNEHTGEFCHYPPAVCRALVWTSPFSGSRFLSCFTHGRFRMNPERSRSLTCNRK